MWGLAAGAAVHLAGCRCGSGGGASGEVVGWALPGADKWHLDESRLNTCHNGVLVFDKISEILNSP